MEPTDRPPTDPTQFGPAPNHHAHHPGFSGVLGLAGALSMAFGRGDAADLARELSGLGPADRLADIGCGPGHAARRAAAAGATVVGVDPAPMMLRVARLADPRRRVGFREGRAEALPLEDGWATVAWTLASVHHWPDVEGGVAEVHRVLAPGGRFVAMERRIADADAAGLAGHGWTDAQADRFAALCRTAGFVDVRVVDDRSGRGRHLAVVTRVPT